MNQKPKKVVCGGGYEGCPNVPRCSYDGTSQKKNARALMMEHPKKNEPGAHWPKQCVRVTRCLLARADDGDRLMKTLRWDERGRSTLMNSLDRQGDSERERDQERDVV